MKLNYSAQTTNNEKLFKDYLRMLDQSHTSGSANTLGLKA